MCRVQIVARSDAGDEIDRDQMRSLMQQLEHRMLGIGAHPAPGNRRGRTGHGVTFRSHRLAVALHLQLLEVIGKQPQPLVIGEYGARLAAAQLGVILVGKGGAQRQIVRAVHIAEMAIDRGSALQHLREIVPAHRNRDREPDRGPQRVTPAHRLGKRQHPGFIDAPFHCRIGIGSQRHHPSAGVGHAIVAQPLQRAFRVGHGFDGGESLGGNRDHGCRRITGREGLFQCHTVDVGHHMHIDQRQIARQGVHRQCRAKRRTANTDMDEMLDRSQSALVNRIDQHFHPQMQRLRFFYRGIVADAALRGMFGGAVFGVVDLGTREQFFALAVKSGSRSQFLEQAEQIGIEMRFRPIAQHPALIDILAPFKAMGQQIQPVTVSK